MVALGLLAAAALPACAESPGERSGASSTAARTVTVDMVDIAFRPEALEVGAGERIRFVFTNRGELLHDAVIGDEEVQAAHLRAARNGRHEHGAESVAVEVPPGKTAELVHRFEEAGTTLIGCHQPGHYDAGMRLTVAVAERATS